FGRARVGTARRDALRGFHAPTPSPTRRAHPAADLARSPSQLGGWPVAGAPSSACPSAPASLSEMIAFSPAEARRLAAGSPGDGGAGGREGRSRQARASEVRRAGSRPPATRPRRSAPRAAAAPPPPHPPPARPPPAAGAPPRPHAPPPPPPAP